MQRRLNIIAGTLHSPALMLLDEPTVGVDIAARERIHNLLRRLRDAGMGILLSTHDFDQAAGIADRVAFMRDGCLVAQGAPADLIHEAFGNTKELVMALPDAASNDNSDVLTALGLRPLAGGMLWSGPLAGGAAELPAIEERLAAAGIRVAEVRVREPGLESVYRQLTAEESVL